MAVLKGEDASGAWEDISLLQQTATNKLDIGL